MLGHKSGQSRDILDNQLKRDDFVTAPHQVKDGKFKKQVVVILLTPNILRQSTYIPILLSLNILIK